MTLFVEMCHAVVLCVFMNIINNDDTFVCSPGSVVLLMMNVDHSEVVLSLGDPQLQKSSRDIYWLTSNELPELTSKYVSLHAVKVVKL